jgi:hypothetical protein
VARLTLTPDLASMVEFDDVGIACPARSTARRRTPAPAAPHGGETRRETWRLRGLTFAVAEGESLVS